MKLLIVLLLVGTTWACPAGPRGVAGSAGAAGSTGGPGPRGLDTGLLFTYSNATDDSVVSGQLQFDADQLDLAANVYIEVVDAYGNDVTDLLTFYTASSSVPAGIMEVVVSPQSWISFSFTLGPSLRGQPAIQLVLTHLSGPLQFLPDRTNVTVFFVRSGDAGADGTTGATGPAGPNVPVADATTDLGSPAKRFRTEYVKNINMTSGGSTLFFQSTGITLPQGKTLLSHYEELSFLCHWDGAWTTTGQEHTCQFVRVGRAVTLYIPGWNTTVTLSGSNAATLRKHNNAALQLKVDYPQFMPLVNNFFAAVMMLVGNVQSTSKLNINTNGVLDLTPFQPNAWTTNSTMQDIYLTWISSS